MLIIFRKHLFPKGLFDFTNESLFRKGHLFPKGFSYLADGFPLSLVQLGRYVNPNPDQFVAAATSAQVGNAFTAEAKQCSRLGSFGNLQGRRSFQSWHLNGRPQSGLGKTDLLLEDKIIPRPLKEGMGFYRNIDVKITRGSAALTGFPFPGHPEAVSRVHTGGNCDLDRADLPEPATTSTSRAGSLNDLSFALTTVTRADGGETAEHGILHRMDFPLPLRFGQVLMGVPGWAWLLQAEQSSVQTLIVVSFAAASSPDPQT